MATYQQGDQYFIPFSVKQGDTVITPYICSDLRISVGGALKEYSKNEVYYDEATEKWKYPLTEDISRKCDGATPVQVGIKYALNSEYFYSPIYFIDFAESVIRERWSV